MWNLPPPPGFQGLHPDKPVTVYERHLPHWRQDGATYFVTLRLGDSLPQGKLNELARIKSDWQRRHGESVSPAALEQWSRQVQERIERWLDQGLGSCLLAQRSLALHITTAMHHFDGDRYELGGYVVLPNHVHAIVRPLNPQSYALEGLLGSWKKYSARRIRSQLQQQGDLWQEESYDRILRDEEHLWRAIQYIGANPQQAGLTPESCPLWNRPEWVKLGWRFVDDKVGVGRLS